MFDNYPAVKEFLTDKVKTCRILVVGDIMFGRDYFGGNISEILPARVLREEETLGGAANAAYNLALLGCKVFLSAVTGADEKQARLVNILNGLGITSEGLVSVKKKPTNIKIRIIGSPEQLPRLEFEKLNPINIAGAKKIRLYVESCIEAGTDVIIISDHGKGLCTPSLCQYIIKRGNEAKIPVLIDPQGFNWQKYAHSYLIAPNLQKLGAAFGISIAKNDQAINGAAETIAEENLHLTGLVVTRSEKGVSLVTQDAKIQVLALEQEGFDALSTHDTFIAVLGAALAGKINLPDAARLAHLAAGIAATKSGVSAASCQELMTAVERREN
ncbi:MAG: PfkB family carbohydrate kinase [Sporomusaceae bacterium]|jgi:D-beta-D-heptose 7-phosphate kinase/D-beta-D-heptose 1-phosphate adenosyltransferase|nr:PfkB family carbohydrate kinase [Sporomusaceae bacterium]